jgi:hypothetical protein
MAELSFNLAAYTYVCLSGKVPKLNACGTFHGQPPAKESTPAQTMTRFK